MSEQPNGEKLGPVQILVVGFENPNFTGEIMAELKRLREADVVRLMDLLVVQKEQDGTVKAVEMSDLAPDMAAKFGSLASALIDMGASEEPGPLHTPGEGVDLDQVWYVSDVIPAGSAAAVALIEHRWVLPLQAAIERAGGFPLADAWVHPEDLAEARAEAG